MNTIYKLTDQDMKTFRGFQWKFNEQMPELPAGGKLCTGMFYHAYTHPLLAIFLNPIHAHITRPRLFKGTGFGESLDDYGLKVGYKSMILEEELTIQEVTQTNRVAFGVLCALEVCDDDTFRTWAENWLSGEDRTKESASTWTARDPGTWVPEAAHASKAWAARAVTARARTVESVESVAWAAAWAARKTKLDLITLAEKAMTVK